MAEENQGRLSVYLQASAAKKLKMLGVEREKPVNTLVLEALAFWWSHQTDVKGPLFTGEFATMATPGATTKVQSPTPPEKKEAKAEAKATPTKASNKGARSK